MKQAAISKAQGYIRNAAKAVADLSAADTFQDASDAWVSFLMNAKSVYSLFELATKNSHGAAKWNKKLDQTRRSDELLQYVFQARNADQHGLEPSVRHHSGGIGIGTAGPGFSQATRVNAYVDSKGRMTATVESLDGMPTGIRIDAPSTRLTPVKSRGEWYLPPSKHLGRRLTDQHPATVAKLALDYLSGIVREAQQFVVT